MNSQGESEKMSQERTINHHEAILHGYSIETMNKLAAS